MTAYYVSKDRGSFLSQGKYPCMLPECILDDQLKKQATDMFIDMIGMEYVHMEAIRIKQALQNACSKESEILKLLCLQLENSSLRRTNLIW